MSGRTVLPRQRQDVIQGLLRALDESGTHIRHAHG